MLSSGGLRVVDVLAEDGDDMQSRRIFLKNGGLALASLGLAPEFLARTAAAPARRRKALVAIFQRGGVDGLNMIVPFGERAYYAERPSIAIPPPGSGQGAAIDLDGFFGLHPRLAPLAALYRARQLAVVHACGSPDATRSHLDAQDYMESATPGVKSTPDGWLNRYLRAREHETASPFRAVALAACLPRVLDGPAPALTVVRTYELGTHAADAATASFETGELAASGSVRRREGRDTLESARMLEAINRSKYASVHGADYPPSRYGEALKQIARLIKADVGLEIAFAESGNWDHHAEEGAADGQLAERLDDFARGLAALVRDLGDRMADVVILTMSEFGRAVAENGNRGTGHGHGNAMLIVGGDLAGGRVYGRWPGLAPEQRFDGRDLAVTTDFRTLFSHVVRHHLGLADPRPLFPGFTGPLALDDMAART